MEIKNVSFTYPNGRQILKDICLKVEPGILGIIGPNGSGKTTLLDIISNLVKPTNGEVICNTKNIGYLFQDAKSCFFTKSVRDELKMSALTHEYKITYIDKRIKDVLKIVNLDEDILNKNPLALNNRDSKLVGLATILIHNPKVIILDEPTVGLNNEDINNFIKLMKMLKNKYHRTIIIVSHDMDLIHKLVDNVVVLYNGEIVLYGNKYQVFNDPKILKKYGLLPPRIMLFRSKVLNKKGIKLEYREEINDLIKDIFRHVY